MEKYTQKQLRALVASGAAVDVTSAREQSAIPESYTQIGYAQGTYGYSGMLFKGRITNKLYAVTDRTSAIYVF